MSQILLGKRLVTRVKTLALEEDPGLDGDERFPVKGKGRESCRMDRKYLSPGQMKPQLVRQTLNKLSTTETSFLRETKSNRSAGKNTDVAWRIPTAPRKECKGYVFIQPRKPPFRGPATGRISRCSDLYNQQSHQQDGTDSLGTWVHREARKLERTPGARVS